MADSSIDNQYAVIALLKELQEESILGKTQKLLSAERNDKVLAGYRFRAEDKLFNDLVFTRGKEVGPHVPVSKTGNIALSWQALIIKDRPSAYAVARKDSIDDQMAAKLVTAIIEFLEVELATLTNFQKAAWRAVSHGTGAIRIIFNATKNKIELTPITIFDYDIQNTSDPDWVIFRDWIDFYEAKKMLVDAGISEDPIVEEKTLPSNEKFKAVAKLSLWYKPGYRFENGKYACLVGGKLVEETDYPYVFPNEDTGQMEALLPIAWFHCREAVGNVYRRHMGNKLCSDPAYA